MSKYELQSSFDEFSWNMSSVCVLCVPVCVDWGLLRGLGEHSVFRINRGRVVYAHVMYVRRTSITERVTHFELH